MAEILLVDDDPKVVARNAAALAAEGHVVTAASTTAEARRHLHAVDPDVVVMEAMLDGGVAGLDLARTLAAERPTLPLIVLTRLDDHLDPDELARQDRDGWLPVSRYLRKPVMPEVLADEIDHLVEPAA
ncbi:MAG TPA: response regulator [Candidatus Dormibacteraeota bacterium]|nr:response regulator [Candidatus Dormibacteraeota bacterium]